MKRVAVFALLVGCTLARRDDSDDPTPVGSAEQPTAIVRPDRRTTADEGKPAGYVGVLAPRETAEVPAPFTSRAVTFVVKLGDSIKKGDTLATLDDHVLREQLAILKATLRSHKAQVAQASVEHGAAAAKLAREKRALAQNVSSEADVAAARFDQSKAGTMVARAVADVEEQKARLAQLEKQLGDATMRAPIDGKVALRYIEDGARVTEGQPVIRVISSDELFVKFAIPASEAKKLAPGEAIDVYIDSRDLHVDGVVRDVAPELDPVAQMIIAEAELKNPPAELQAGLVCRIAKTTRAK